MRPSSALLYTVCLQVADVAGKEYSIEMALDKMMREWDAAEMGVLDYRETKTFIIKVGY